MIICIFLVNLLNIFLYLFYGNRLKAKTFSEHGEGGNSEGIDGRGKLAYNEFFIMHIVTTCSIHKNSQNN